MLVFFVMGPIMMAIALFLLPSKKEGLPFPFEKAGKIITIATQIVLAGCASWLFFTCKQGEMASVLGNYSGLMGITLRADTLSSVFLVLTAFVFLIAGVYSYSDNDGKLYCFLLFIWQGLLNGLFLTRDLFNVFVLVEVVTVVVAVMIMYKRGKRSMYDGLLYLMLNTVVMQLFLFGIGYIYKLTGVLDMDAAASSIRHLDNNALALPFALIMTAVCFKCALTPFFIWLPKAHGSPGAPAPVSAILSGVHIKCGVYLFIRFQDFFQDIFPTEFFLTVGVVTGLLGCILALAQTDIKLILAYSTMSQIGMLMAGLNLTDSYSYTGSIYHVFNHALFKAALFLSAGVIAETYGTREIDRIRGVMKRMPVVGAATVLAILGIIGAPLFNGSVSKYFIVSGAGRIVSGALMLNNLGTITIFVKYAAILFGKATAGQTDAKQTITEHDDAFKQIAVSALGIMCFAGGLFGEQFIHFLFDVSVSVDAASYGEKTLLFAVSLVAGLLLYRYGVKNRRLHRLQTYLREIEIGFKGTCVMMGAFFAVTLIVLYFR